MLTRLDYIYMTALVFVFSILAFSDWETPMPLKPAT